MRRRLFIMATSAVIATYTPHTDLQNLSHTQFSITFSPTPPTNYFADIGVATFTPVAVSSMDITCSPSTAAMSGAQKTLGRSMGQIKEYPPKHFTLSGRQEN